MKRALKIIATLCVVLFIFSSLPTFGQDREKGNIGTGSGNAGGGAPGNVRANRLIVSNNNPDGSPFLLPGTPANSMALFTFQNQGNSDIKINQVVLEDVVTSNTPNTSPLIFAILRFHIANVEIESTSSTVGKNGNGLYIFNFQNQNLIIPRNGTRGSDVNGEVNPVFTNGQRGSTHEFRVVNIDADLTTGWGKPTIGINTPDQDNRLVLTAVLSAIFPTFGRVGPSTRTVNATDRIGITTVRIGSGGPNESTEFEFELITSQTPTQGFMDSIVFTIPGLPGINITPTRTMVGNVITARFTLTPTGIQLQPGDEKDVFLDINSTSLAGQTLSVNLKRVRFKDGLDSAAVSVDYVLSDVPPTITYLP